MDTGEAADQQVDRRGLCSDGRVGESSYVSAVHPRRHAPARRARGVRRTAPCCDPDGSTEPEHPGQERGRAGTGSTPTLGVSRPAGDADGAVVTMNVQNPPPKALDHEGQVPGQSINWTARRGDPRTESDPGRPTGAARSGPGRRPRLGDRAARAERLRQDHSSARDHGNPADRGRGRACLADPPTARGCATGSAT